ncbi:exportin-7 [Angomonas deanei]|uniref:Uncharacterized protein n=1 Tax=Angomonas deanei TaxID=59799 RepID=A0A7G2CPH2_9TRYP|nr:exportin-7 [Angomonas deanei]CAD2220854.1 hypothetical protein, conserved [Angomonas deanei]|eukprot:EPY21619.1 exportin-7 [Angomonas deanei]
MLCADAATRFVAPFGYRDLHVCKTFEKFISLLRQLSLRYFSIPFGQEGSLTTTTSLVTFWERLCHSRKMYGTHEESSTKDLELVMPELCSCFFQSRVNVNNSAKFDSLIQGDEDYENLVSTITNQSSSVASMTQMDVQQTFGLFADYVNQNVGPSVLSSPGSTAWLFFMAGAAVSHVLVAVDKEDVRPCSQFFTYCVDCANHRRMSGDGGMHPSLFGLFVEQSLLHFMQAVQRILIGSRTHDALTEIITNVFQTKSNLFQFVLSNTGHNVTRAVLGDRDEETAQVMSQSIDLIFDACRDMTPQVLAELHLNLPPVVELPLSQSLATYKLRSNLYRMLWLLHPHTPYHMNTLLEFLQPIERYMENTLNGSITNHLYVAGWLRDLRGVSLALRNDMAPFCDFAEWYCNQSGSFSSLLQNTNYQSPMVLTSFLRFLLALVDGSQSRYPLSQINNQSALGILVFKCVCSQIQTIVEATVTEEHIQQVTSGNNISDKAFDTMLKPLSLCITCLQYCVQGGFVPFGAMWVYQDETYDNTLLGLLRMVNVFPQRLFKDYSRVTQSILELLRVITDEQTYHPLAKLSAGELDSIISFVLFVCEDVDTDVTSLMAGMTFLSLIAGLIKEVKQVSLSPSLSHARSCTPPATPLIIPAYYASPDGRLSNTPGQDATPSHVDRTPRSLRQAREQLAQTLEPFRDLWIRLLSVAMNIITLQDRGMSISVSVVYPIFETHPPFWYAYLEQFIAGYPERKRAAVREAASALTNAGDTQSKFFSEIFSFRQQLRSL